MEVPQIPDKKYFTIGEAAKIAGIKPYVLRYWESEFKILRPARRESGQRRYTRNDLELIFKVKTLLHEQKYSIAGAKRKLIDSAKDNKEQPELFQKDSAAINLLTEIKKEIKSILKLLE